MRGTRLSATGGSSFFSPLAGASVSARAFADNGVRFAIGLSDAGGPVGSGSVKGWSSPMQIVPASGRATRSR